ncbi:MAG: NAD(P)H-hydrate dehydratase [Planctomycetaceae bacterium]|nr:NAD(P)H-hydrate dehydratase [Planctomycetaceae bacterium]|tara:strand:+ start:14226 stop:15086 length:861 start_codon:yes stop_codon:yes gene_type:complete
MSEMPVLEPRSEESHKGDYGRLLCVGGSRNMSGAISLTASAALRSGAGLVSVATAKSAQAIVASHNPCVMTIGLSEQSDGVIQVTDAELNEAVDGLARFDVLAIGPGLDRSASLACLLKELYQVYDGAMVIDADGINNLDSLESTAGPRVLTPHPGEFKRLLETLSLSVPEQRQDLEKLASELAKRYQITILLKGSETLVTNGTESFYNATGNPGMATAGSGDVLTGVIAALLAQQFVPLDAALMGAYLHGLAGDLAVGEVGEISLVATDLIEYLPAAFQHYQAHH